MHAVVYLWVGVFAGEVSKVTEDLALHVVFQGGEPAVGLLVHGVVQLQELHQLFRLHLQGQEQFLTFKNHPMGRGEMDVPSSKPSTRRDSICAKGSC